MREKRKMSAWFFSAFTALMFTTAPAWAFPFFSASPLEDTLWINTDSCKHATPFCADSMYLFANILNAIRFVECCPGDPIPPPIHYDDSCCLNLYCNNSPAINHDNNPKWFVMKVVSPGEIQVVNSNIEHNHLWPGLNPEYFYPGFYYHLWGPYDAPDPPCVAGLTPEKKIACHDFYISSSTPHNDILSFYAEANKFYYLIVFLDGIVGYDTVYHYFWQGNAGEPGAGVLSCEGITECSIYHITTIAGPCNPQTNTFTLSGKVFFYNAPSSGQLVIYDSNTGYSTVFNAPFVSPLQYSIPGIPCDNELHTLIASFWNEPSCSYSGQYQAPVLCPDATLSGGGQACSGDSLMLQVALSPFVQTPVTFTLARNGQVFDTITSSGPFPCSLWIHQAGIYSIDTVFNALCPGNPSGMATVQFYPLPQPNLGNDITTCEGRPVILDAGPGFVSYQWNTDEKTQSIQVSTAGFYEVQVVDSHGCSGSDSVQVNFVPAPQPLLIKHN